MSIRISVVINAYKNNLFLPQALNSVLDQEFGGDFEILVLSPTPGFEASKPVLTKASDRGVRLETVSVPPGPAGLGLYRGVRASKGDVIALLDDDDLWEEEKLARVDIAFRNPRVVYFHHSQTFVDEQNRELSPLSVHRLIRHPASLLPSGMHFLVDASNPKTLARGRIFEPDFQNSSITIRKDALQPCLEALHRVTRGEDTFLYYCALASRGTLEITTDRLTRYRIHYGGITASGSGNTSRVERIERYVEYADGQQDRLQLIREKVLESAIPEVASSLDSDQAFWATMRSVATGSSTRNEASIRTRMLLGDAYARPRMREMTAVGLGWLSAFMPGIAKVGFSTWRGIW